MSEKENKNVQSTKVKAKSSAKPVYVNGIIGIMSLLVVGSIACMAIVIWTGTENNMLRATTIPAIGAAVVVSLVAFSKILK